MDASLFVIGANNPPVAKHLDWFEAQGCVVTDEKGEKFVQVIPMVDLPGSSITREITPIPYDSVAMSQQNLDAVMKLIERRIEKVIEKSYLISKPSTASRPESPSAPYAGRPTRSSSGYPVAKSSEKIRKIMEEDLGMRGLLK